MTEERSVSVAESRDVGSLPQPRWGRRLVLSLAVLTVGVLGLVGVLLARDTGEDLPVFGFIRAVDVEAGTIEVDPAEWLTGRAAAQAAVLDGQAVPGTTQMPNGFYIRNPEPDTVTVPVAANVTVTMSLLYDPVSQGPVTIDLPTFARLWTPDAPAEQHYFRTAPYRLTSTDGAVSGIAEQYIP
ncbi:MAG TPA: hypothetical protein VHF25_00235 [Nitriliruptorales bacterium]|nr:hypothetical protein [Nitriliruptorales bacterium]